MTTRREFLRTLVVGLCAAPILAKAIGRAGVPVWVENPAWKDAPYELGFAMSPETWKRFVGDGGKRKPVFVENGTWCYIPDEREIRLDELGHVVDRWIS